jgi:guanidinoacetate N-methyltransferase
VDEGGARNYRAPVTSAPPRDTRQTRIDIGFVEDPRDWKHAAAIVSGGTLQILGHPVMEDWETPYMRELAHLAAHRGGAVLEVGFGLGISAGYIQEHAIEHHVIIEANAVVFGRLEQFAASCRHKVTPVAGLWQEVIGSLPSAGFRGILFDTYPLRVDEIHCAHFAFFEQAHRLLEPGGILTYYSDEASHLSAPHEQALRAAGFSDISYTLCPVDPPPSCQYWASQTILAPRVVKS